MMCHMVKATLRDLRYKFDRVNSLLQRGEEIQITKRGRVMARLLPPASVERPARPDFAGRLKQIYGDKVLDVPGAELLAKERNRP
jgi:antitoxin (DNA-binding transcriptional repressor) of toxin-antitoxin stability system